MNELRRLFWELIEEVDKTPAPLALGCLADRCRDYLTDHPEQTTVVGIGEGIQHWGRSWLETLLKNVDCSFKYHGASDTIPIYENCVVISSTTEGYPYIKKLQENQSKFGIILVSDECLTTPLAVVNDPNCVFMARNYLHPECLNNPKIFHFGLGYKNNLEVYAEPKKNTKSRQYVWSFNGSLKADRREALHTFAKFTPNHTHLVKKFNDPDYLSTQHYAYVLNNSQFVLAPAGGASNDSFRIYEALECGAIPIVMRNKNPLIFEPSYWHGIFNAPEMPFIVADSWQDAANSVKNLIESAKVEDMRQECLQFWQNQKRIWQKEFERRAASLI